MTVTKLDQMAVCRPIRVNRLIVARPNWSTSECCCGQITSHQTCCSVIQQWEHLFIDWNDQWRKGVLMDWKLRTMNRIVNEHWKWKREHQWVINHGQNVSLHRSIVMQHNEIELEIDAWTFDLMNWTHEIELMNHCAIVIMCEVLIAIWADWLVHWWWTGTKDNT